MTRTPTRSGQCSMCCCVIVEHEARRGTCDRCERADCDDCRALEGTGEWCKRHTKDDPPKDLYS